MSVRLLTRWVCLLAVGTAGVTPIPAAEPSKTAVEYAKKLGKDVVDQLDQKAFLKKFPDANRNVQASDPSRGLVVYETLFDQYMFRDGKLVYKAFVIPRTVDGFPKHHTEILDAMGKPDEDLITEAEKRDGVLYHAQWDVAVCDLMVVYIARRQGREVHQSFHLGSITAISALRDKK